MLPAVDILILSWNRVDDTIAAIQSAHDQVRIDKRILIVDQGSEPANLCRLRDFLKAIPDASLLALERNVGVAAGRNRAAELGSAEYLVALDSDAVFADPSAVERALLYLSERPDLCAIGFRITNFFTRENDGTSWDYPAGYRPHESFETTRFIGAGHAIRRSIFEQVGGYDDRLFFCGEEVDLCYRMLNTGARIQYFPGAEILHKVSPEHRFFWGRGRYFYTVRNNLYSAYKFGTPLARIALSYAAFTLRGFRNGMPIVPMRAAAAAFRMCRQFRASSEDKHFYRLSDSTRRYIAACEPSRSESFFRKLRRQFVRLPHQV